MSALSGPLGSNKLDTPLALVAKPSALPTVPGIQESSTGLARSHHRIHQYQLQEQQLGGNFKQRKEKTEIAKFNKQQAEKERRREREKKKRLENKLSRESAES